jgi:hypothetical protein
MSQLEKKKTIMMNCRAMHGLLPQARTMKLQRIVISVALKNAYHLELKFSHLLFLTPVTLTDAIATTHKLCLTLALLNV